MSTLHAIKFTSTHNENTSVFRLSVVATPALLHFLPAFSDATFSVAPSCRNTYHHWTRKQMINLLDYTGKTRRHQYCRSHHQCPGTWLAVRRVAFHLHIAGKHNSITQFNHQHILTRWGGNCLHSSPTVIPLK